MNGRGVEFRILGSVEVDNGGVPVDLGGLRERTLLARLLLAAGQVVSAERLADDLWAGEPPPHSMATLRVYISRLRRALGPAAAALVTQPPGYRIQVGPGQLDASRFDSLVSVARRDLDEGKPEAAAAGLRTALALWRGPPLSDVADFAFAQADVARLEEARLGALEDRVEADLACGRHAALTSELDGLTAAHPLRERLCGQQMLALYRCGRQADALRVYRDLGARLADELGIDPNPRLHRLHEAILRQLPELDWVPAEGAAARSVPAPREEAQEGGHPAAGHPPAGHPAVGQPGQHPAGRSLAEPAAEPRLAAVPGPGLPAETTSFVGREAELATIKDLLGLSRLLTLTGPGGSGKTRLALRAGAQASSRHPGGVWLVELAQISRPELVVPATATAMSVREEPGRPLLDSIIAGLAGRDLLLIIDNCEHVVDAVAELAAALLRGCPELRILATSQSRLGLAGEATWPVPPLVLPLPDERDPRVVAEAESVRLFCDRAALARPGFGLTAGNVGPVSEICRRLDGIPLALELAAARVNALSAGQLAARLDDRFRLLAGPGRRGLPRHRTLQAAIEWSHDLLSEAEQVCLRRLAIFAGGCTLEAAEAVCPGSPLAPELVFQTVTSLVDRSLLTAEERLGSMRYGMLESIHQFARQKLEEAGEGAELSGRLLGWLLEFAAQADLDGPDQGAWLDLLDSELDNFRAGLEWSLAGPGSAADGPGPGPPADQAGPGQVEAGAAPEPVMGPAGPEAALALAGALAPFWMVRGHIGLGRRWLDAALAAAGPGADRQLRAIALDGAGQLAAVHGDFAAQRVCQQESLAIWRELGDDVRVASCLGDLGAAAHISGDYPAARVMYTEALDLASRAGEAQHMARSLSGLGRLALHAGDLAAATRYYTESMARFSEVGDLRRATLILGNLGVVALDQGDPVLAAARLEEHLGNARKLGDRKLIGGALTNLGMIAHNAGDLDRAARQHAEALDLAEQVGDRRLAAVALTNLGLTALARKDFDAARAFHRRSLELAEAIGERRCVAESLEGIAEADTAEGNPERAAVLFGASRALRAAIGSPVPGQDLARLTASVAATESGLGHERFRAALAAGEAMSIERAVELARETGETAAAGKTAAARETAAAPEAAAARETAAAREAARVPQPAGRAREATPATGPAQARRGDDGDR
jgi:predicted ATPase/DNA-binding SARP family transcriptional activator/Tfp pilus assembly protein PilF